MIDYCEIYTREKLVLIYDATKTGFQRFELISEDVKNYPFLVSAFFVSVGPDWRDKIVEFDEKKFTIQKLEEIFFGIFLKDRVMSRQHQGLEGALKSLGLKQYDFVALLEATHGSMFEDYFWIKLDKADPTVYADVKIRD